MALAHYAVRAGLPENNYTWLKRYRDYMIEHHLSLIHISKVGDNSDRSEKYPDLKGGGQLYYGAHLGLQGNVRLSSTLDLFVEPRIGRCV